MRKTRVLFVCVGNSCRSQMAEGFARKYGSDVLEAHSAGVCPAVSVSRLTREVMARRNIDLSGHFPKGVSEAAPESFDLIVNMSGEPLPAPAAVHQLMWDVQDPIGGDAEVHEQTASQIETLVMQLILELRARRLSPGAAPGRI